MKKLLLSIACLAAVTCQAQSTMKIQTVKASQVTITNQFGLTELSGKTNVLALTETDAARVHTVQTWDGDAYDSIWFNQADGFSWSVYEGQMLTGPGVLVVTATPGVSRHSVVVLERIKIVKIKGSPY